VIGKKGNKGQESLVSAKDKVKGQGHEMSKTEKVQGNVRKARARMVREGRVC
jgi:hypothetical protein